MEEREEGEISEAELSDISSEEEYLLRQRLQVLESYNNVLEKKEAKRRLSETSQDHKHGKKKNRSSGEKGNNKCDMILPDLSDVSGSDLENSISLNVPIKTTLKSNKRSKKPIPSTPGKNISKASHSKKKYEKLGKSISLDKKESSRKVKLKLHKDKHKRHTPQKKLHESSDETDDEYRNKRRKLQHSVQTSSHRTDQTSLKMRLLNMFSDKTNSIIEIATEQNSGSTDEKKSDKDVDLGEFEPIIVDNSIDKNIDDVDDVDSKAEIITISDNSDAIVVELSEEQNPCLLDSANNLKSKQDVGSDDDIEILRQNALQTKVQKVIEHNREHISDSEDSEELRMICLRSKMLRNRMEWRRKIKMHKKLANISTIDDFLESKLNELSDNSLSGHTPDNTDMESVDMEIGLSDGPDIDENILKDDELKTSEQLEKINNVEKAELNEKRNILNKRCLPSEDFEEDEDLLRAKLLTSLSNNLQKQYKTDTIDEEQKQNNETSKLIVSEPLPQPETKQFIINIGESDSGSENETTKNLKEMHKKLAQNVDFQDQLDILLKNARKEAENKETKIETVIPKQNSPEKFVPKVVKHLPKSGQLEYKRLVKRIAELERIKQNRQAALNRIPTNKINKKMQVTITRNEPRTVLRVSEFVSAENQIINSEKSDLETKIAFSRKRIATESAKVLRLKEESSKLGQKYKMIQTELRNIRTAMSINKREVMAVQASLTAMRNQHQLLLKRSGVAEIQNRLGSNHYVNTNRKNDTTKPKEANILSGKHTKNISGNKLKLLTVSVVNDLKEKILQLDKTLSVNIDTSTNKKVVTENKIVTNKALHLSKSVLKNSVEIKEYKNTKCIDKAHNSKLNVSGERTNAKEQIKNDNSDKNVKTISDLDDYTSPLSAMKNTTTCDPNGILCPYEVLGACKDSGCQYQHPASRLLP